MEYIALDNPAAAERVVQRIEHCWNLLTTFPDLGHLGLDGRAREIGVKGTPYILVYDVIGDAIYIERVRHGARRWPPQPATDEE